jgi:hypothetical protein
VALREGGVEDAVGARAEVHHVVVLQHHHPAPHEWLLSIPSAGAWVKGRAS